MRQLNIMKTLLVIISLAMPGSLFAFYEYWPIGISARAIGAGGVPYASSLGTDEAIYWNSGGLTEIENFSFTLMYYDLYGQGLYYRTLTLAKKIGFSAVGVGFYQMSTGTMDKYIADGTLEGYDDVKKPVKTGTFSLKDSVISVALARELSDHISLGIVYNRFTTSVDIYAVSSYTVDLGVIVKFSSDIKAGFNVRNLYAKEYYYSPGSPMTKYPKNFEFSLKFPHLLWANLFLAGKYNLDSKRLLPAVGLGKNIGHFEVTAGYDLNSLSMGLNISLKKANLSYAIRENWNIGLTHIMSVNYSM